MNNNNKISVYAESAEASSTQATSETTSYYYPDATWQGLKQRKQGAHEGIAYSIEYNTAIRQATCMSSVLAEALAERNEKSNAYKYMTQNGIGTTFTGEGEGMETHVTNLATILNKENFLLEGEVTTPKINDNAVTTEKIKDYNVTASKLNADVLGTKTATVNGITVTLSQPTKDGGAISVELSGTSTEKADTVKTQEGTGKYYLVGANSVSGYPSLFDSNNIYMTGGDTLCATKVQATSEIQAESFYATSDQRKKEDIQEINHKQVQEIVEKIKIYNFKYKDTKKESVGVIAQDLVYEKVGNFKLVKMGSDGFYTVCESKFVYILLDYVQQLSKKVKEIESEVEGLKKDKGEM